jgi:hypothetical protein
MDTNPLPGLADVISISKAFTEISTNGRINYRRKNRRPRKYFQK